MNLSNSHPAQRHSWCVPMPPHPIAAEQARYLTSMALANWGLSFLAEKTLLIVSELVTNALKQGDIFRFALHRYGDMALVEVTDTSLGVPAVKKASDTDTDGRGLLLVQAFALDWGVRYERNGSKTVWAKVNK